MQYAYGSLNLVIKFRALSSVKLLGLKKFLSHFLKSWFFEKYIFLFFFDDS